MHDNKWRTKQYEISTIEAWGKSKGGQITAHNNRTCCGFLDDRRIVWGTSGGSLQVRDVDDRLLSTCNLHKELLWNIKVCLLACISKHLKVVGKRVYALSNGSPHIGIFT